MARFPAIEGLRAWLAWAVVFSHIGQTIGMDMRGGHWVWLVRAGENAVLVFIVVSGFVICGLVLERGEKWPQYILRRAFRIFPAYWVAYAAALAAFPLALAGLEHLAWAAEPAFGYPGLLRGWEKAMADHPGPQLLLHVALLQGLVPDSIWPSTSTAVLGPAWSLTLEWQFYFFAPALIWLLSHKSTWFATAVGIIAGAVMWRGGYFGTYAMPTILPMAAYIFLIGIVSRLYFQDLKSLPLAPQVPIVLAAMGLLFKDQLWLAVWLATLAVLLQADSWDARRFLPSALCVALQSRAALYLGTRSYSVYLVHLPIIQVLTWLIVAHLPLSQLQLFFVLIAVSVPVTLLASDLLYRLVERPMIRLGTRLAYGREL